MRYLILVFVFFSMSISAQEKQKKIALEGYVSFMNTNSFDSIKNSWMIDNQFYNRINFFYYPTSDFTFTAQLRNRLIYGNSMLLIPNYQNVIGFDYGIADLSFNAIAEKNLIVNFYFDRLNFKYSKDKWEIQFGRQRVNWGKTFVWNPNDIFNSYSYFDFDYEEKPGSDALRIQYYTGPASSVELAAKVDNDKNATAAVKWLINKWNYDIQLIAAELNQKDYYAGLGWAGNIWKLGFKGEAAYFKPILKVDSNVVISATASLDYSFNNSFYLMAQVLYTKIPSNSPIQNFESYYSAQLSAKYLSFAPWNLFAQASYPITPLLTSSLAGMYYPQINGFFVSPTFTFSLAQNVDASIVWQYFKGEFPNMFTGMSQKQQVNMGFLRLKWNF